MVALPNALLSLTRAVGQLDETVREARETVAQLQRLGSRLEGMLDDVEEPVRDLAPGLRRMAEVLDDPAVSDIPDTIRRIREDLLPVVATLRGTSDILSSFPGRSLLGGRRRPEAVPTSAVTTTIPPVPVIDPDDPDDAVGDADPDEHRPAG